MSAGELAPCLGIIEAEWSRIENQTQIASNSGESDVLEIGDPFWAIDVSVNIIDREHFDVWDSFLARRRLKVWTGISRNRLPHAARTLTQLSRACARKASRMPNRTYPYSDGRA